jgi:hypothetical protein
MLFYNVLSRQFTHTHAHAHTYTEEETESGGVVRNTIFVGGGGEQLWKYISYFKVFLGSSRSSLCQS